MPSDLPPLPKNLDHEYDAFVDEVTLEFPKCDHKKATIQNGKLRCVCGAEWQGAGIKELLVQFQSK